MKLNAQVLITDDAIDIADYVISLSRDWIFCSSIQTFDIILDPQIMDFLPEGVELKPSDKCVIYEHGVKVFTGHINTVKFQRKPDPFIVIQGADNYKFVKDFFIDESLGTSNGETVAHWVGIIMDACNLPYQITSSEVNTKTVAPGIEFNLKSADEALSELLAYAFSHSYCNQNGIIIISSGEKDSDISFESGPTVIYDDLDPTVIEGGNVTKASHQKNDANTRSIIKVWGWKGSNLWLRADESPYIQAIAYGEQPLPVDKTMLYSSSMIQDYGTAQELANRMASEMGHYDSIKSVDCIGNPNIMITQKVRLNIDIESEHLTGTARITSIHSNMSNDGYIMQVKMDEFCPKFAAWSSTVQPQIFYAGTLKNGVYKSTDGGVNWFAYNTGLPVGTKKVTSLATTSDDEVLAIVNGQVWYTTSSGMSIADPTWTRRYLPAPVNTAGDDPAPSGYGSLVWTAADGEIGNFQVLTTIRMVSPTPVYLMSGGAPIFPMTGRSWMYYTTNAGVAWRNDELYYIVPSSGYTDPSGYGMDIISYDLQGQHISNRYGLPLVTAASFVSEPGLLRNIVNTCYLLVPAIDLNPLHVCAELTALPYQGYDLGIHYVDFQRNADGTLFYQMWGKPGTRTMRFGLRFWSYSGWSFQDKYVSEYNYNMSVQPFLFLKGGSGTYPEQGETTPSYLCTQYSTEGIHVTQSSSTPDCLTYTVTVEEKALSSLFWIKFGLRLEYICSRGLGQTRLIVYAGELPVFDEDCYPWEFWPTWPKPIKYEDTYPLALTLCLVQLNMDDYETSGL